MDSRVLRVLSDILERCTSVHRARRACRMGYPSEGELVGYGNSQDSGLLTAQRWLTHESTYQPVLLW